MIAVTLVTAAVARAHIAPAMRWNGLYFAQFVHSEVQMVILVAVIIALIAAAVLCPMSCPTRSPLSWLGSLRHSAPWP